jgi:hypothetical protein
MGMPLRSLASLVVFFIPLEVARGFQVGGVAPLIVAALLYLPAGMASNPTTPGGNSQGCCVHSLARDAARTLLLGSVPAQCSYFHLMLNWLPRCSGRGLTKGPTALAQAAFVPGHRPHFVGVLLTLAGNARASLSASSYYPSFSF